MEKIIGLTADGKKMMKKLMEMSKKEVLVGYARGTTESDGTDLVDIAIANEYGTSTIPARPFMKQAVEKLDNHNSQIGKIITNCLAKDGSVETALNQLGVIGKGYVQKEFVDGDFVPNAPTTIARKGSDRPLIDTGTLRQSVTYIIREREGKE